MPQRRHARGGSLSWTVVKDRANTAANGWRMQKSDKGKWENGRIVGFRGSRIKRGYKGLVRDAGWTNGVALGRDCSKGLSSWTGQSPG